jgi:hypothetical protein
LILMRGEIQNNQSAEVFQYKLFQSIRKCKYKIPSQQGAFQYKNNSSVRIGQYNIFGQFTCVSFALGLSNHCLLFYGMVYMIAPRKVSRQSVQTKKGEGGGGGGGLFGGKEV